VLVVGQTPPPYHGQAIGIESLVTGSYTHVELFHVRMNFSSEIGEVGRFRPKKLLHLVALVARVLWKRVATRAEILYYPPAGSDLVPVLRDLVVLASTRWAFRQTVFHFHAAGLADVYQRLPRPLRAAFRWAYFDPDLAILPAPRDPSDATFVRARRQVVVPYGVPDVPGRERSRADGARERPVILFVGALRESKGVLDLLDAAGALHTEGLTCEVQLMGAFSDPEFEQRLHKHVAGLGLGHDVTLLGVRTDGEKVKRFSAADIFCFPTRYEAETFGIVVIEAMRASLPVVATRWRGLPSLVGDGDTGFLVPVHDVPALTDRLRVLLLDKRLRLQMGRRGRESFLERFTEERYRTNMEAALADLASAAG
jgi:glycosyltransferase involved in cell wall biosynthesis